MDEAARFLLEKQVLDEDLGSHEDQDQAAGELGFGFVADAEKVSGEDSGDGEQEGGHADKGDGGADLYLQEGEGYADGQSIDAGGNGQNDHGAEIDGRVQIFFVVVEGFLNHIDADDGQQDKGNPVVKRGNGIAEMVSEEIADERHAGLKSPEIQADDDGVYPV